ncbi:hypothetical protein [Siminovitchia sp. 179-K 8D1 HS]|uniref:hypothetical protein n=1 Tax=Siminovitchia sp. 179-K 8D1 HS TaxID=3142385 RepID=UPI0039A194E6
MSKYQAYRSRVQASGKTSGESLRNSTKIQQADYFMSSPSLSYVRLNNEESLSPSIVSDENRFLKRRFLFLPDTVIKNGMYIEHDNFIYLITESTTDDIYPQAFAEICNDTFKVVTGTKKVEIDRDDFNRPIHEYIEEYKLVHCVLTTKAYSTAENAAIPLPDGTMLIKIPYNPNCKVSLNYLIEKREQKFKVTNVSYENVLNEIGYIEITLQRVVK